MTRELCSEGWAVDKVRIMNQIKPKYLKWTPGVTRTIDKDKCNRSVIDPYDYEPLHQNSTQALKKRRVASLCLVSPQLIWTAYNHTPTHRQGTAERFLPSGTFDAVVRSPQEDLTKWVTVFLYESVGSCSACEL